MAIRFFYNLFTFHTYEISYCVIIPKYYLIFCTSNFIIILDNSIDRELFSSITLVITVEDMGISTLFSLASITITVNDQNDIGPLFQMRSYAMSIAENFDTGKL